MTERADHRWMTAEQALVRRLPDGFIVLTPGLEDPLVVAGPAASLWVLLDDRPTFEDIVADLARSFDTSPDQVRTDIADLWTELVRVRAVVPAHACERAPVTTVSDESQPIRELALASATFGLEGAYLAPPPTALDPATWNGLARYLTSERLWGPVAWAAHDGWWPTTDEQLRQTLDRHRQAMATVLGLEQRLLEVTRLLRDHDIDPIVLKGPAVARLDHPEPSLRSFADIDLLVGADEIERTADLLQRHGGVRRFAQPRRGFDQRFGKGMSLRFANGQEIDVHRTLSVGPFGLRIDPDELRASTTEVAVGDERLRALDLGGRFFHACVHASLGSAVPRIATLRDVAVIVGPSSADDGVAALLPSLELAREWQCGLLVAYAVHAAAAAFQWLPPRELRGWIDDYEPSPREWRWLAGYRDGNRSSARHALESLTAIDSWSDRVRYAVAVTVPRSPAAMARWKRGARDLTGWAQA